MSAAIHTVEHRAQQHLRGLPYFAFKSVSCEFEEGRLILRGQVPSYFLKQLAQTAAAQVDGVKLVENQIEVQTPRMA